MAKGLLSWLRPGLYLQGQGGHIPCGRCQTLQHPVPWCLLPAGPLPRGRSRPRCHGWDTAGHSGAGRRRPISLHRSPPPRHPPTAPPPPQGSPRPHAPLTPHARALPALAEGPQEPSAPPGGPFAWQGVGGAVRPLPPPRLLLSWRRCGGRDLGTEVAPAAPHPPPHSWDRGWGAAGPAAPPARPAGPCTCLVFKGDPCLTPVQPRARPGGARRVRRVPEQL